MAVDTSRTILSKLLLSMSLSAQGACACHDSWRWPELATNSLLALQQEPTAPGSHILAPYRLPFLQPSSLSRSWLFIRLGIPYHSLLKTCLLQVAPLILFSSPFCHSCSSLTRSSVYICLFETMCSSFPCGFCTSLRLQLDCRGPAV